MDERERHLGVLPKWRVERRDDPDGKHRDCFVFVLDPKHDALAYDALTAYASAARVAGYQALHDDLMQRLDRIIPT